MKIAAIITAAGVGQRMKAGRPKQYLEVAGKPIIVHTLERFADINGLVQIIVTVPPGDEESFTDDIVKSYGLSLQPQVVAGGDKRQDSVRNGLAAVADDIDVVVIHDGVRPFIRRDIIHRSIDAALEHGACVVAAPLKETIKRVGGTRGVSETVDRSALWGAQTPQTFRAELIREAFASAARDGFVGTDDAMLVERLGKTVKVIEGDYHNIKITTQEDLLLAEVLCKGFEK